MESKAPGKRVYFAPKVVRVMLTHEQAVLSACAVGAVGPSASLHVTCNLAKNCKSWKDNAGNSAAAS